MILTLVRNVLLPISILLAFTACQRLPSPENSRAESGQGTPAPPKPYRAPRVIAELKQRDINESSGLVAAHAPGVYWTHNDSGDGPFLYAVNERGESCGVWRVAGAEAHDWEDIAAGPGPDRKKRYLYVGDIGDNGERRSDLVVYRIPEPNITAGDIGSTKKKPRLTEPAEAIKVRYPDGRHNAETLLVHPVTGDLYLVTKAAFANPIVYKASAPLTSDRTISLVRKAELNVPSLLGGTITGGGISPNGRLVALCDYLQGYELVLPSASNSFDDIWKQPMSTIDLGRRRQGEAVTYRLDGKALLATSEGKSSLLIEVVRR